MHIAQLHKCMMPVFIYNQYCMLICITGLYLFKCIFEIEVSFLQTLREPAIFAKGSGTDSEVPHDKVTLAQARRGTPGKTSFCAFK